MTEQEAVNDTYVGDYFTYKPLINTEETISLTAYKGMRCKLLGFKPRLEIVAPHRVNATFLKPGIYKTIGNPLVRFDSGRVFEVCLDELEPEGYSFDDSSNMKNVLYVNECSKYIRIADLPHTNYNVNDKVLVAKHNGFSKDFLGEIIDIVYYVNGVSYLVVCGDDVIEVQERFIIDAIEKGDYSQLMREYELTERLNQVNATLSYLDLENKVPEDL